MRFPTQGLLPDAGILLPRRLTSVRTLLHFIHQNGSQQGRRLSSKLKGRGCCPGATTHTNLLERTPCPVGGLCASDTGSCRLLQGPPQLGAVVTLLFSWLPIKDLARPPRACHPQPSQGSSGHSAGSAPMPSDAPAHPAPSP